METLDIATTMGTLPSDSNASMNKAYLSSDISEILQIEACRITSECFCNFFTNPRIRTRQFSFYTQCINTENETASFKLEQDTGTDLQLNYAHYLNKPLPTINKGFVDVNDESRKQKH